MKKTILILLIIIILATMICLPTKAISLENNFNELLNWNGIIFGDVNNVIDVEGKVAVENNFISTTGFSVNSGAYGNTLLPTDDISFLVNNNINITGYGNVYGRTIIGNAEGNVYHLSNITNTEITNGQYIVEDNTEYFEDLRDKVDNIRSSISTLEENEICESAWGTYTFVGDSTKETLVYTVDDSNFNSYLFDFTITEGQTIIVNFTTSNKIDFKYGGVRINGSMDPDYLRGFNRNIILNVIDSQEIEMTSCELYGILIAPNTSLIGKGANICGTSILKNLTGSNGFELHVGFNNTFVPNISTVVEVISEPIIPMNNKPQEELEGEVVDIRIDVPRRMAVSFTDGSIYYGGEIKKIVVGKEYLFQMCSVNWSNGIYDGIENGLCGTVVYRMIVVHKDEFNSYLTNALQDTDRYTIKGIDIIDNNAKTIIINCDEVDFHLETDVNNFFMAYRFHFEGEDYNKKTGIEKVVNNPLESLSVNLPLGSTITCKAFIGNELVDTKDVFISRNSGEGIYNDIYLTSVNDYTWIY